MGSASAGVVGGWRLEDMAVADEGKDVSAVGAGEKLPWEGARSSSHRSS